MPGRRRDAGGAVTRRGIPFKEAPESCDCRFKEGGLQRGDGIVWGADGLEKMGGGLDGGTMSYVVLGLSVWWWYKDVAECFLFVL